MPLLRSGVNKKQHTQTNWHPSETQFEVIVSSSRLHGYIVLPVLGKGGYPVGKIKQQMISVGGPS